MVFLCGGESQHENRPAEIALVGHIGDRQLLLLLDNCEHLIEPVARLAEALLSRYTTKSVVPIH